MNFGRNQFLDAPQRKIIVLCPIESASKAINISDKVGPIDSQVSYEIM